MKRDKSSREAALSRLNAQLPITEKLDYADHVLENSGSLQELESHVGNLVRRLEKEVGWTWRISWLFPPAGLALGGLKLLWRALKRSRSRKGRKAAAGHGGSTPSFEMSSRSRL